MVPHPRGGSRTLGGVADHSGLMGGNLRLEVPKGSSAQVTLSGGGIEGPEGVHPAAARAHVAGEMRFEGPRGPCRSFRASVYTGSSYGQVPRGISPRPQRSG